MDVLFGLAYGADSGLVERHGSQSVRRAAGSHDTVRTTEHGRADASGAVQDRGPGDEDRGDDRCGCQCRRRVLI
ncbi:hypothetical protein [Streptomyces sp. IBSBF 3136]|uniref:hypothetical protein n=1 Tax=Streptomyces sp. IBSBF 3136 TaxID=2903524 RepID=UPI002FDC1EE2